MLNRDLLRRSCLPSLTLALALAPLGSAAAQGRDRGPRRANAKSRVVAAPATACALLDDVRQRNRMDGLLFNLLWSCGRQHELGQAPERESFADTAESLTDALLAVDTPVNNAAGESGSSTTQSETSITYNPLTGTYCSAFNDSWEYFGATGGGGFTGFARSTNDGASWQDQGAVGASAMGDPSLAWRRRDGFFYLATLESGGGLSVWRSVDDCQSFTQVSIPTTGSDDKEILTVDNNPTSPHYGNLYLVWTDFDATGAPIRAARSTDGGATWSAPLSLSAAGPVQGAWPAVAPDGAVYVAWLRYASWPAGDISVELARSADGGASYTAIASPLSNAVSPRDAAASTACGRPALRGSLRYLASPQIAVTSDGTLHVVYAYDPDGFDIGDVVNVYYRRSTDNGAHWSDEVRLNDVSANDQYFGAIHADGLRIVTGWYDRRNDPDNLRQDYYKRVSGDAGVSWGPNVRVTDVNSPIRLDPDLATCYHGDYDQVLAVGADEIIQWADDRNFVGTRNDPDVWSDVTTNAQIPDFAVSLTPASLSLEPGWGGTTTVAVISLGGYSAGVTLSCAGQPAGVNCVFAPVTLTPPPDGSANSTLTVEVNPSQASGSYSFAVVASDGSLMRSAALALTITGGQPVSVTFTSLGAEDGHVQESSETSNSGGSASASATNSSALRVGDLTQDRQIKSVVSFDTSSIPDGATITAATLRLVRGSLTGTNPFTTHGTCQLDIVSGAFGGASTLDAADFQATPTARAVGTMSNPSANGSASSGSLNAAGLAAINKVGRTQLRVSFALDDNDDGGNDYLGFYSGENSTAANRPTLTVTYTP